MVPARTAGVGHAGVMASDPHAEADATFGPCLIPGCPGSVWALWERELEQSEEDPPKGG